MDDSARPAAYRGAWLVALCVAVGLAAGLGLFTFRYADGLSYFSRDPAACVNCHIMRSQYDSWQKSSHHTVALCVDCHLPHDFVSKYLAKAENGWRHSKEFTAQTFHEPIFVQAAGRAILQENCVECHRDLTHDMAVGAAGARGALACVHCHAFVGHGDRAGLGGPLREPEPRAEAPAPETAP